MATAGAPPSTSTASSTSALVLERELTGRAATRAWRLGAVAGDATGTTARASATAGRWSRRASAATGVVKPPSSRPAADRYGSAARITTAIIVRPFRRAAAISECPARRV